MKKIKLVDLSDEVRAYIVQTVERELKRDPEVDSLKFQMLRYAGCCGDDARDKSIYEIYEWCMNNVRDGNCRMKIKEIAAQYFYEQLIKGGCK